LPEVGYPLGGELTGFRKLVGIIERLGKLSGGVTVAAVSAREPVPDWLAARLVNTVGMAPQDVAALSLEEAVDRWGEYMSKPRQETRSAWATRQRGKTGCGGALLSRTSSPRHTTADRSFG
jgi:hypothetical protein